ncbi:hypothetical protein QBC38DRAFT_362340 [Podospora fimiseda]|uniref:Uncharacterized protein n=1 Tax=Podospora fimiseda TaxID=252190 RepID=A0AAN7H3K3_9PEZI|nr:hypothetical protein QBC38DRAFT_362340 [Podospora fimiseda]
MSPFALNYDGVGWLESRDDTGVTTQTNAFNNTRTFQSATNQSTTQQQFINQLRFSAAKSIRTSTIILASFNIIAAFATAVGILCDSYFREKRNNREYRFWRNGFKFVPEGEVYPLILSLGIFVQSLIFAGAQSTGLDSLFGPGCTLMAMAMLPAVFLAPYIQLVYGIEIALRAIRKQAFEPRGKWNVTICSVITGLLVFAMFLVAQFDQSPNFCLTSLFWFVAHYSAACFGIFTFITVTLIACSVVLFVKLHSSINIEVTARVNASRMVYYLALAAISIGFMLPFFYVQAFKTGRRQNNNALTLSMVAAVVANVSGLMTGGLYLFLKSNTLSTIGPRDKAGEYENRRAIYKARRFDDDEESSGGYTDQVMNPVGGPQSLRRANSETSLYTLSKEDEVLDGKSMRSATTSKRGPASLRSYRSNNFFARASNAIMPRAPERARVASTIGGSHMRKQSYSLFPNNVPGAKQSFTLLPATTYSPNNNNNSNNDNLKPPPSMGNLLSRRHKRDSSLVSSATVQIGLRFSSVEDIPAPAAPEVVSPDHHVYNLDCPLVQKELQAKGLLKRPTGLDSGATTPTTPANRKDAKEMEDDIPARDPVKDARMKTLPPVPRLSTAVTAQPEESTTTTTTEEPITLSPSVYSPTSPTKARLPSPRGVGFTRLQNLRSPPMVPPPLIRRGTGDTTLVGGGDSRNAWI